MQGKFASNRVRTNSDKLNRTLHRAFSSIVHVYQRDETAKQIRARHAQHLHMKHSFYLYLACAMRGLEVSDESLSNVLNTAPTFHANTRVKC